MGGGSNPLADIFETVGDVVGGVAGHVTGLIDTAANIGETVVEGVGSGIDLLSGKTKADAEKAAKKQNTAAKAAQDAQIKKVEDQKQLESTRSDQVKQRAAARGKQKSQSGRSSTILGGGSQGGESGNKTLLGL